MRRELFDRVGGFEDWLEARLGKPLAEDAWLGWRAAARRGAHGRSARRRSSTTRSSIAAPAGVRRRARPACLLPGDRRADAGAAADDDLSAACSSRAARRPSTPRSPGAAVAAARRSRWPLVAALPWAAMVAPGRSAVGPARPCGRGGRGGRRRGRVRRPGDWQRARRQPAALRAVRRPYAGRAMRVLTVGNMYPPHHLGGYELMWRSSVSPAARRRRRGAGADHRLPAARPRTGNRRGPRIARELRWYWHEHEFPPLSAPGRLRGSSATTSPYWTASSPQFGPDAVAWWAMGGMSMSLLGRAREAGVPAVGVVVDEWLVYGPRVDAWRRGPGRSRLVGRLAGVPSGFELGPTAELAVRERLPARTRGRRRSRGRGRDRRPPGDRDRPVRAIAASGVGGAAVCLGRVDSRKGVATVIGALGELPECTLRCVGAGDDGHLAGSPRSRPRPGSGRRVSFDRVDRARSPACWPAPTRCCFCVEWPEPFGIVPLEAMAVGMPVIATGTGGSAEYLEHRRNCLVVEPGDAAAVAAAVQRLAGDPELRERLRAGGLRDRGRSPAAGLRRRRSRAALASAVGSSA